MFTEAAGPNGADIVEVPRESGDGSLTVPAPTWTPEGPGHEQLRERIVSLLRHGATDPALVTCRSSDVFLYPSGMGAMYHAANALLAYRPGTAVVLGVVFHNTIHHLSEEAFHGCKQFGDVSERGLDELEAWLKAEREAGRSVSFLVTEVPGNPTLEMADLNRLKALVS
jgi:cystathionine gamma-synthase